MIENGYNGFQAINNKSLGRPEHIFNSFRRPIHVLFQKMHVFAVFRLIVTLRE
jgi:hypothetical protein